MEHFLFRGVLCNYGDVYVEINRYLTLITAMWESQVYEFVRRSCRERSGTTHSKNYATKIWNTKIRGILSRRE